VVPPYASDAEILDNALGTEATSRVDTTDPDLPAHSEKVPS
jgi:hypothetical protein